MNFPEEIKQAISAIDHNLRWRILEEIQENERLSYTQLLQKLEVKKGSLNYHLNKMMEGGIIDNYSGEEFRGHYNSYYQLSPFGKDFVTAITSSFQVVLPFQSIQRHRSHQILNLDVCTRKWNDDRSKEISIIPQNPKKYAKLEHKKLAFISLLRDFPSSVDISKRIKTKLEG